MRSLTTLALVFLLAASAFAQEMELGLEYRKAKTTVLKRLPRLESPVAFSPDGASILYVVREAKAGPRHLYVRASATGEEAVEVFTTRVQLGDWFGYFMNPGVFSADGESLLVLATEDDEPPGGVNCNRALLLDEQGNRTKLPAPRGACSGFGFAGGQVLTLDLNSARRKRVAGYSLRSWKGSVPTELVSSKKDSALGLSISPDQTKVAYLVRRSRMSCVEVYDLKTKSTTRSKFFTAAMLSGDAPQLVFWDHESEGLFLNSGDDCHLARFDLETKQIALIAKDLGIYGRIGRGLLLVAEEPARDTRPGRHRHPNVAFWARAGVLRLEDRTFHVVPKASRVLGGRGNRIVVAFAGQEDSGPALVELELSK